MMNRKKYTTALLLLVFTLTGLAQTVVPSGSPSQVTDFKGGIKASKTFSLPVTDAEPFPGLDKLGQLRISPTDSIVRYFNGTNWVKVTTEENDYVTNGTLADSLEQVKGFAIDEDMLRIPYAGATSDVNLGIHNLTSDYLFAKKNGTPSTGLISYLVRTQSSTGNYGFRVYEDENGKLHVTDSGSGDIVTNVKYGPNSLYNNTTGAVNSVFGFSTLYNNTTGSSNTAVGSIALYSNTTGNVNTALGHGAGYDLTSGSFNTFIGRRAGFGFSDGSKNLFVHAGTDTGSGITSGNYNVIVGSPVGSLPSSASNLVWLGDGNGNPTIVKNGGAVDITGTSLTFNGVPVGVSGYEPVRNIKTDVTSSSNLTGTTGETILKSYEIAPNTLSAGYIDVDITLSKTGTANTIIWKVYKNTSNSLSGATQIATYTMPANLSSAFFHREYTLRGTGIYGYNPTSNFLSDDTATSSIAIVGTTFVTSATNYIIITGQLTDAADTAQVYTSKIIFTNAN